ncbi:MAG: 1-acyl-sn-glycerol-3-phosphate acyltransferase [Phycisphaerales bacterium]|nr:1-acyl-sn-glycerol-3-phosphate acyltransferase [Phycisphaerales bacterium]
MLSGLRRCDSGEPLRTILFYRLCRFLCLVYVTLFYRLKVIGRDRVPMTGGLLVVANHQSHLDPVLIGVGLDRRNMASLARSGLFKNILFGLILRGVGSIPIRQEEGDAAAIRTAIGELKKGRLMLIFPEGSRSPDGALREFKRGAWLLMSRSGCDVLPAAVEGAFDAWPRSRKFPGLFGHRCAVMFGQPVKAGDLKTLGPDAGLAMLAERVDDLRLTLREQLRRSSGGRRPAPGAGDGRATFQANA